MNKSGTARIGVFNVHWKSLGGGELHALNVAKALTELGTVDLISHDDFDMDHLGRYFDVDISAFRKRLVSPRSRRFSADYDIFVNGSFNSRLVPRASISLCILYFPFKAPKTSFLRSYTFLPSSKYTMKWLRIRWGQQVDAELLYPAVRAAGGPGMGPKRRLILSIGRFTASGNSKKQLEMIEAFRVLRERHPAAQDWRLVLIGSLNRDVEENVEYLRRVTALAAGLPVEILPNAPVERVREALAAAPIFWHFAGLGEDEAIAPERFEHFGIAVVEAMMNNCWPIVFNGGGPKEIVESVKYGETGADQDDLVEKTAEAIRRFGGSDDHVPVDKGALALFSEQQLHKRLTAIVKGRTRPERSFGRFGRISEYLDQFRRGEPSPGVKKRPRTLLPNFFIIGANKSGTTSLHRYLGQHPQVFFSRMKEPSYYTFEKELIKPRPTKASAAIYPRTHQDTGRIRAPVQQRDHGNRDWRRLHDLSHISAIGRDH